MCENNKNIFVRNLLKRNQILAISVAKVCLFLGNSLVLVILANMQRGGGASFKQIYDIKTLSDLSS